MIYMDRIGHPLYESLDAGKEVPFFENFDEGPLWAHNYDGIVS